MNARTGKRALPEGYSPRTVNHCLSVVSGLYRFHARLGEGPVVNADGLRGG